MLLVLVQLKSYPDRVATTQTVPGCQCLNSFLGLAIGVQPSRGFWDEERANDDQSWEDQLEPDRDEPGAIALDVETTASGTRSQDGANQPGGVAKTCGNSSIPGVSSLDDPDGTGSGSDIHAKPEKEAAAHHLAFRSIRQCRSLDDGASDDDCASNDHSDSAAESVNGWANERESASTTDLVHGGDKTSPDTLVLAVEVRQKIFLVGQQTAEQHGVEAVHSLAEKPNAKGKEEQHDSRMGQRNGLLEHGLIEGFAALDFLDFDHLGKVRLW